MFHEGKKSAKKAMVSAVVSWDCISKPFFVVRGNLISNSRSYLDHLRNNLIPAVKKLYPNNNFILIQDSASSYRAKIAQNFLWKELKSRFLNSNFFVSASLKNIKIRNEFIKKIFCNKAKVNSHFILVKFLVHPVYAFY